jgi:hypothetical protein
MIVAKVGVASTSCQNQIIVWIFLDVRSTIALSNRRLYSDFWVAANIRLGFVVASCGWYARMLSKSPVSAIDVWLADILHNRVLKSRLLPG